MSNVGANELLSGAIGSLETVADAIQHKQDMDTEFAKKAFEEASEPLTPEETETLEKMRKESRMDVTTEDSFGRKTSISAEEYIKPLDDTIVKFIPKDQQEDAQKSVKLLDPLDLENISEVKEKLSDDVKSKAIAAINAISANDFTTEDFENMSERTMDALRKMFNTNNLDSERVTKALYKMPLAELRLRLPPDLITLFCSEEDLKYNQVRAKENLITSIAYLIVTGPELDELNDYLDHEHLKMDALTRLTQCNVKFTEAITSEQSLAEIVAQTANIRPKETTDIIDVFSEPDKLFQYFNQSAMIADKMAEAYETVRDEFTDEQGEVLLNAEIEVNRQKGEIYRSICHLDLLRERAGVYLETLKSDKRTCPAFLEEQAVREIDRIRKLKISLPFPGFDGKSSNPKEIFLQYQGYMWRKSGDEENPVVYDTLHLYSNAVAKLKEAGKDISRFSKIPDTEKHPLFYTVLLLVMVRLAKRLTSATSTKFDAIVLDGYFRAFCTIETDMFVMSDVIDIITPIVDYVYAIPNPKKKTKK